MVVVVGVGYPFVAANPKLALSSFRVQSIRPPWQSVWAMLDGFYGYGLVPLDMRNLAGLAGPLWATRLPWGWITLAFALVYLWLYTRPYDWRAVRTPVAFTAVSVILLFLYSKGWSPQFLVWVLVFIALLLPTPDRGGDRHRVEPGQLCGGGCLPDPAAGGALDHERHGVGAHGAAGVVDGGVFGTDLAATGNRAGDAAGERGAGVGGDGGGDRGGDGGRCRARRRRTSARRLAEHPCAAIVAHLREEAGGSPGRADDPDAAAGGMA